VGRSQSLIKPADSSFSPKWLEGQPRGVAPGCRATESGRGAPRLPAGTQLRRPGRRTPGVRAWGRSFTLERERTQTADQGPQDDAQWQRKWDRGDSRDVGLEAATISKVRNSLPVEPSRAENEGDSSVAPQSRVRKLTVGERRWRREAAPARSRGAPPSAYAGTSNDKGGGKPPRRKHKVSWGRSIRPGSVGS
jgi:hypothetical protein